MDKFISIITVNYNGEKYLGDFLNSTRKLDYPKDKFEVIVVDNASSDGSVVYVKRNFPEVKIIESPKNLGFGAGNNLGIQNAKGDSILLVNNDTALDKNVLKEIVSCFLKWSKRQRIGAVNAKLVLFDSYLPLVLRGATFTKCSISGKGQPKNPKSYVITFGRGKTFGQQIFLPLDYQYEGDATLSIFVRKTEGSFFELYLNSDFITRGRFGSRDESKKMTLCLDKKQIKEHKIDLIQNAGNILFRDGFGRDRGVQIINYQQFYEPDRGQYEEEEPIQGFCGAGVLLNRKALKKVGLFDKNFFMYYEDGDLSLRLKKEKWEIIYCPKAVIRHIHAGSSKEWSPFFNFHVEKNRLLFVAKHWPRFFALREWGKYLLYNTLGVFLYYLTKGQREESLEKLKTRLKVNFSLLFPFIIALLQKKRLSVTHVRRFF